MDNKSIFASNLKKYMTISGITRKEISETLGISYFTVTDWVKGKKYPRMDKVELLAQLFRIQKSDLIEEKENSPEELALSEGERLLLELFRQIPVEQQNVFLEMGRVYANSLKKG